MAVGKLPQVTKGFIAIQKDGDREFIYKVEVKVFNLGFYINTYIGLHCIGSTNRTGKYPIKTTTNFIDKQKAIYKERGCIIKDLGFHKVKTDKDGFFISII